MGRSPTRGAEATDWKMRLLALVTAGLAPADRALVGYLLNLPRSATIGLVPNGTRITLSGFSVCG